MNDKDFEEVLKLLEETNDYYIYYQAAWQEELKMTLKEFFESKQLLAIHLKTKEQSIIFSKEADKLGKKWGSGASYVEFNFWDGDKEKTCYDNK